MSSTSTQTPVQDDPLSLFALLTRDAEALAALRAAYSGPHDVLDAVWWREHPLVATPGGVPDPAAGRAALQALAYSREGARDSRDRDHGARDPDGGARAPDRDIVDPETGASTRVSAAAAQLFALETRLRADSIALEEAIRDARPALEAAEAREAAERNPAAASVAENVSAASEVLKEEAQEARPAAAPSVETWRKRSMIWMWTSIAAGLLLITGVTLVVVQQLNPQSGAGFSLLAGSAGTATPTPGSTGSADLPPGLTIFEDPELAPSIPPANIDPYYKPESLRLLGVADSELTVYAVENRIDQPCLLAVYEDGTQSATCVTKQEFASMGIELRITSLRVTKPGETAPYRSIAEDVVFWNPDGSYGVSSSPTTSTTTGTTTTTPRADAASAPSTTADAPNTTAVRTYPHEKNSDPD